MADTKISDVALILDRYDTGLLGDGGGGDVNWWWDYIRSELERAHEFYQDQADNLHAQPAELAEQQGDALQTVPYYIAKALIESAYTSGTHGVGFGVQSMALKDAILKGTPIPSDTAATRRFIAERTPQPEHRQDVLDGDFDGTAWFSHVQAALATTGKQQVVEVESLPPEMRPSDPEYLDYLDSPKQVSEVQAKEVQPVEHSDSQWIK